MFLVFRCDWSASKCIDFKVQGTESRYVHARRVAREIQKNLSEANGMDCYRVW
jgi:hypothetical protein